MHLIAQTAFAQLFYNTYTQTTNASNKVQSILLDVVNQLIQQNNSTIKNLPTGVDLTSQQRQSPANTTLSQIDASFNANPTISNNITLLGETHGDPADVARATAIISTINATATPVENLIVFERGMTYPAITSTELIREDNLSSGGTIPATFYQGLSPVDRSYMVAAYLVARVACGNQQAKNNILLFFGQRHSDIFTFFDRISSQSGSGSHLLKIPRNYNLIVSNA